MRQLRFRIRTLLIVVAVLAVLMGLLTLAHRWLARTDEATGMLTIFAMTVVAVIPLLVLVCSLSFYFRRARSRGEFLDRKPTSDMENKTRASGEFERV
jgi:small-conductance mechanosensitive channel